MFVSSFFSPSFFFLSFSVSSSSYQIIFVFSSNLPLLLQMLSFQFLEPKIGHLIRFDLFVFVSHFYHYLWICSFSDGENFSRGIKASLFSIMRIQKSSFGPLSFLITSLFHSLTHSLSLSRLLLLPNMILTCSPHFGCPSTQGWRTKWKATKLITKRLLIIRFICLDKFSLRPSSCHQGSNLENSMERQRG